MALRCCVICGKDFKAVPARKAAKLCSNACRYKYQGMTRGGSGNGRWLGEAREKKCEWCGTLFRAYTAERKFCSKACGMAGQKRFRGVEHPRFNPDARGRNRGDSSLRQGQWAAKILARDGAKCQRCGATGIELHAHHLKSWKDHPQHRFDLSNGLTLCYICHWNEHSQQQRKLPVDSVNPLTGNAEGDTEPSANRKIREGVTASGRAYRRVDTACDYCGDPISRSFGHAKGKAHLFCNKVCAGTYRWNGPKAVISTKSAGRESENIA